VFEEAPKLDGDGMLRVPEGPGYGVKWSAEGIRRLSRGA
jgi:L-alanine-DL-glutamate epimerase-like enolase superfamily enzyme